MEHHRDSPRDGLTSGELLVAMLDQLRQAHAEAGEVGPFRVDIAALEVAVNLTGIRPELVVEHGRPDVDGCRTVHFPGEVVLIEPQGSPQYRVFDIANLVGADDWELRMSFHELGDLLEPESGDVEDPDFPGRE